LFDGESFLPSEKDFHLLWQDDESIFLFYFVPGFIFITAWHGIGKRRERDILYGSVCNLSIK
jgi:hypothetical protein